MSSTPSVADRRPARRRLRPDRDARLRHDRHQRHDRLPHGRVLTTARRRQRDRTAARDVPHHPWHAWPAHLGPGGTQRLIIASGARGRARDAAVNSRFPFLGTRAPSRAAVYRAVPFACARRLRPADPALLLVPEAVGKVRRAVRSTGAAGSSAALPAARRPPRTWRRGGESVGVKLEQVVGRGDQSPFAAAGGSAAALEALDRAVEIDLAEHRLDGGLGGGGGGVGGGGGGGGAAG